MGNSSDIISKNSYVGTFDAIIDTIRARKVDLDVKHILFTPDKYTLYAEQRLYGGTNGAFDAEVLTLNRLFFRIASGEEYLSRQDAVMLMRKIIAQNADKLTCFARSSGFLGFGEKMYETIAQLSASNIYPQDIVADGALGRKLSDISLLYSEYIRLTKGKFIDACGRMELLKNALDETSYFDNVVVYFCNFDFYTPQTQTIINKICAKAKKSYIGMPNFKQNFSRDAVVYEAADIVGELKFVARQIRNNVIDGDKYSDICVVAQSPSYELLRRVFGEFDIPFHIDKKYILGEHQLAQFLKLLIGATTRGDRLAYISLAKNFYSGVDKRDSDIFENYCNKYCIDFGGFSERFTKGENAADSGLAKRENARLAIAEKTRKNINDKILAVEKLYDRVFCAADFSKLISEILVLANAKERTIELEKMQDCISWGDVCEKLEANATTLGSIYSGKNESKKTLVDAYFEGLMSMEVSLIPNFSDCVIVGEAQLYRGRAYKRAYIVGFNEGFPMVKPDCGMITDSEIERLKVCGVDIQPKICDVNERSRVDALSFIEAAQNLVVTYSAPTRPSFLIANINPKTLTYAETLLDISESRDGEFLSREVASGGYARELLARGISRRNKGYGGLNIESELREAIGKSSCGFMRDSCRAQFLDKGKSVFFRNSRVTISQVQEYFLCPYRHFLTYGLKLCERESGELSPLDIGNFLHKVIEIFVSRGQYDDVAGVIKKIVEQTIETDDKYHTRVNDAIMRQISVEAEKIASVVVEQFRAGYMRSIGQEIHFGDSENALKTLSAMAQDNEIFLYGIIDRADSFNNDVRVVDYKTGHVEFKFSDLYYGVKIQLMLYMKIMMENGYKPAGMFYFPFSTSWSDDEFSHRLLGVYNNDISVAMEMDAALENGGVKSKIFGATTNVLPDANGNIVLQKTNYGFSSEDLGRLATYAYEVLSGGVREIGLGNIAPSPRESGGSCACDYCKMRCVCEYNSQSAKTRQTKAVKSDVIIASVQ